MFLLVESINDRPKTWTVVSPDLINDGTLRKSKRLVGKVVGFNWNKRVHQGLVVAEGSDEASLEQQADELAEKEFGLETNQDFACSSKHQRRRNCVSLQIGTGTDSIQPSNVAVAHSKKSRIEQINKVLSRVDDLGTTEEVDPCGNSFPEENNVELEVEASVDWKGKYERCKRKLERSKRKLKSLQEEHELCAVDEAVELVEGSGVKLLRSEVAALRTMSSSITFLARNLFRRVFVPEDIIGHSLLGRRSTAVQNHVPLPSVDPIKRDAIIDFCIKTYGFDASKNATPEARKIRKSAKTMVIKSLSDYVREENVKARKPLE